MSDFNTSYTSAWIVPIDLRGLPQGSTSHLYERGSAEWPAREFISSTDSGLTGDVTSFHVLISFQAFSPQSAIAQRFNDLATAWRRETIGMSSPTRKIMSRNYWDIYSLGSLAIPLILEELERRPDDWFVLLEMLAGENPVKPEDKTSFKRVVESWLKWGHERKLL